MPITALRLTDVIGTGSVGLTARHTDALELHHVQLNAVAGPTFAIESAANLELDSVTTRKPLPMSPVLRLTRSPGAVLRNSRAFPATEVFLSTGPGELKSIHLDGNILTNARSATEETGK